MRAHAQAGGAEAMAGFNCPDGRHFRPSPWRGRQEETGRPVASCLFPACDGWCRSRSGDHGPRAPSQCRDRALRQLSREKGAIARRRARLVGSAGFRRLRQGSTRHQPVGPAPHASAGPPDLPAVPPAPIAGRPAREFAAPSGPSHAPEASPDENAGRAAGSRNGQMRGPSGREQRIAMRIA